MKNSLNSPSYIVNHVTPRKRRLLHFPCLFGNHSFGAKNLQGIRIWTKSITTQCIRIWTQTLQRLRCWFKNFQNVWYFEKKWIHKITIWIMLLLENGGFCIFHAFSEIIVLEQKTYKASEFELNLLQRFIFWSEKDKRCEILKKN